MTDFAWQLIGIGAAVLGVVMLLLWLWNRRERRREHAIEILTMLHEIGMPSEITDVWRAYAVGNYLGPGSLARKAIELVQVLRSEDRLLALFRKMFFILLRHYRDKPEDRTKILAELGLEEATVK